MLEPIGKFNNDWMYLVTALRDHGIRDGDSARLLNVNLTLTDPRNRILISDMIGFDLPHFIRYAIWQMFCGCSRTSTYQEVVGPVEQDELMWQDTHILGNVSGLLPPMSADQWTASWIALAHQPNSCPVMILKPTGVVDDPESRFTSMQFSIVDNKLFCTVNVAQTDLFAELALDVFTFTMYHEKMLIAMRSMNPELELGHFYFNMGVLKCNDVSWFRSTIDDDCELFDDVSMAPMTHIDLFNAEDLVEIAKYMRVHRLDDVSQLKEYKRLDAYWQVLLRSMFSMKEDALHILFNHEE